MMKYTISILAILVLVGGVSLLKSFSKNILPYEGISGIEFDFPDTVTMDAFQLTFANNKYPEEIIFYNWDGKDWQEQAVIPDNQSPDVNISNFKDTSISTDKVRVVFAKPHKDPNNVNLGEAHPFYKNNLINSEYLAYIYAGRNHVTFNYKLLRDFMRNTGVTIYIEKFVLSPQLLNFYFTTRPFILILYTLFLSFLMLSFIFIPGYVCISFIPQLSELEKLCTSFIVSLFLLFLIGSLAIILHKFFFSYIYLFLVIVGTYLFIVKGLYKNLFIIPKTYFISICLIFLCCFVLSLFLNTTPHLFLGNDPTFSGDYLIPYHISQVLYHGLDYHSKMSEEWFWGWHLSDRTPLLYGAVFPLYIIFGNLFKVFEIFTMLLVCLFPLSVILLSGKWFTSKTALLTCFFVLLIPHIYTMSFILPFKIIMTYMLLISIYFIGMNGTDLNYQRILLAGFCGIMAYLVHPNALPILIGLVFYPLFTFKDRHTKFKAFLLLSSLLGIVFVLWNVWSRIYDRPSLFYLYPLCLKGYGDALTYSKEVIIQRFNEASVFEIIGNRIKSFIGLLNPFYGRADFFTTENPYYKNTLTGAVMLSMAIFSYLNLTLKFNKLRKQIICFIFIPLAAQLIINGWYAKEMGIYITPIIFLVFLFGINYIEDLNGIYILLINLICIIESFLTVWAIQFNINQTIFSNLSFINIFIMICIISFYILNIYFLFKTVTNKMLYASEKEKVAINNKKKTMKKKIK